jgi:hypothetical protein
MAITNPYPVDSTTRRCCGGIGRHTRDCDTTVQPPAGADADIWEGDHRDVYTHPLGVLNNTNDPLRSPVVSAIAVQWRDGTVDVDGIVKPPSISIECPAEPGLTVEQARSLALCILHAAFQLECWTGARDVTIEYDRETGDDHLVMLGTTQNVAVHRASREGLARVGVYTHAVQLPDGTISNRAEDGGPGVSLETTRVGDEWPTATSVDLSPDDARALAVKLVDAAAEVDGWVQR